MSFESYEIDVNGYREYTITTVYKNKKYIKVGYSVMLISKHISFK